MTLETTTLSHRYAEYLLAEGRSERTIENYRYALEGFSRFLGDHRLEDATSDDILTYQVEVAARGLSDFSVRVATYALRGFFHKILHRDDWTRARLPKPSRPYRLPEVLSREEVESILEAAPSLKYAAAFMLCYGAGLRTEEVIHLEPRHIDSKRMVIRIERGKGNKDRLVILPKRLLLTLRECWKKYRPQKYLIEGQRPHALEALFAAASETILEVGARKGVLLAVLAVLHTWNQLLDNHPHIHCLVPGGGFGTNGFVVMKRFLLSYKRLRHVFKVKLLQKLRALLKEGVLSVSAASAHQLFKDADSRDWNMKVKRSLAGPDAVIKYFARYTKGIALSESRIVAYDGNTVTFKYRNRRDGNRVHTAALEAPTFCQRFLNHVLPPGFVRIRRTGFLSNRCRKPRLEKAREALGAETPPPILAESRSAACLRIFGKDPTRCTQCPDGRLVVIATWRATTLPIDVILANLIPRAP